MPVLLIGSLVVTPETAHAAGPSTPVLVSPTSGGGVNGGHGQLFTVRSTDPNGDPYYATIEVNDGSSFSTSVVPSGTDATGTPSDPIPLGTWMWRAKATTKADTSTSPPGATVTDLDSAWSAWQSFTVLATGPSVPILLSPSSGGGVNGGPGQLFTVRSTDPSGDPYYATIEVSGGTLTTTFTTGVVPSGQDATGTPTLPVAPGTTWSWRAKATTQTDVNVSPPGGHVLTQESAWSAWQPFTVSSPPTFGAGVVSGQVNFQDPLPGAIKPCAITNFTFNSTLNGTVDDADGGAVINIQGHAFTGRIDLSGTGTGACANASAGSGTVAVTGTGFDPAVGTLSCSLSGYFVRLLSYTNLSLGGTCGLGGTTTAPVNFKGDVLFRPDQGAGDGQVLGVDQSVTHALFAGTFTVTPA